MICVCNRVGKLISFGPCFENCYFLMKVCALMREFVCVQETARITQAHTNVLVMLDAVAPFALLTLMNVNLHHAEMVSNMFPPFSTKAVQQFRKNKD